MCNLILSLLDRMKFYILFVFAFSSFFDTSNAIQQARRLKITMCVVEPEPGVMQRILSILDSGLYPHIEITTCQPHEVCSPNGPGYEFG